MIHTYMGSVFYGECVTIRGVCYGECVTIWGVCYYMGSVLWGVCYYKGSVLYGDCGECVTVLVRGVCVPVRSFLGC